MRARAHASKHHHSAHARANTITQKSKPNNLPSKINSPVKRSHTLPMLKSSNSFRFHAQLTGGNSRSALCTHWRFKPWCLLPDFPLDPGIMTGALGTSSLKATLTGSAIARGHMTRSEHTERLRYVGLAEAMVLALKRASRHTFVWWCLAATPCLSTVVRESHGHRYSCVLVLPTACVYTLSGDTVRACFYRCSG